MIETTKKKLLLVDDDDNIRWVLNELFQDTGYQVIQAASAEEAIKLIHQQPFHLAITDIKMSGQSGIELLEKCQKDHPQMPVIIMTAHSNLDSAVNAYQKGAFEYLPKPFDLDEVVAIVDRALTSNSSLVQQSKKTTEQNKFSIIGESSAMQDLYRAIGRLSNSHVTVLLHGDSGTGKELVANALHQHSPRKQSPFIALNMAAIPKDLIESELFGHEKGAFTGASGRYLGRFEQANNGTLFLDEIGDMPLEAQTRLLRVLSEGAFYRIGSTLSIQVNVRIIAATHQNLLHKVERGEFREDLYHRLNVIPLHLPALRQRSDDIPLLANFFLHKISQELSEHKKQLSNEAIEVMQNYTWPGNVRQLENVCRWLSVMANSQLITPQDLPTDLQLNEKISSSSLWQNNLSNKLTNDYQKGDQKTFIKAQTIFEKTLIQTALKITSGKKAEASRALGWGRNTLTRKLKNNEANNIVEE